MPKITKSFALYFFSKVSFTKRITDHNIKVTKCEVKKAHIFAKSISHYILLAKKKCLFKVVLIFWFLFDLDVFCIFFWQERQAFLVEIFFCYTNLKWYCFSPELLSIFFIYSYSTVVFQKLSPTIRINLETSTLKDHEKPTSKMYTRKFIYLTKVEQAELSEGKSICKTSS